MAQRKIKGTVGAKTSAKRSGKQTKADVSPSARTSKKKSASKKRSPSTNSRSRAGSRQDEEMSFGGWSDTESFGGARGPGRAAHRGEHSGDAGPGPWPNRQGRGNAHSSRDAYQQDNRSGHRASNANSRDNRWPDYESRGGHVSRGRADSRDSRPGDYYGDPRGYVPPRERYSNVRNDDRFSDRRPADQDSRWEPERRPEYTSREQGRYREDYRDQYGEPAGDYDRPSRYEKEDYSRDFTRGNERNRAEFDHQPRDWDTRYLTRF